MESPDYEEWKRRQLWTLWQAASLMAGRNPANRGFRKFEDGDFLYAVIRDAHAAITLGALECFPADGRTKDKKERQVRPSKFLSWANSRGHPIPSALKD